MNYTVLWCYGLYSRTSCVLANGQHSGIAHISTPRGKPLNWLMKLETWNFPPKITLHAKFDLSPTTLVVWVCHVVRFLSLSCAQFTLMDRFWWSVRHIVSFCARSAFWVSRWYCSPFRGQSPKHPLKGAWISTFKPSSLSIKTCILLKLLHRFQPYFA